MRRYSMRALILFSFLLFGFSSYNAYGQNLQADGPSRVQIKSAVLGEERTILVRLPAGYERSSERYPVLYMTDGDAHMTHTSSTIEFLARNGRISDMIVVGITNTDRTRDLTPTNATLQDGNGRPIQFPTSGGADNFLRFIETELIPYVEGHYRTQPYRVFAGHSLGGLFAVHAFLAKTDLFNAYIAVSPSLQWDNEVELKRAQEFLKDRKELKKTLFVSLGDEQGGILNGFKGFKDLLDKSKLKGFHTEVEHLTDEDHGSVVLRSHYMGLRKVFEGWQLPRDPQTGAFTGGLQGAEEHYKKLSEKFGYTIQIPENLVNALGYQYLFAGKMEEAIATFETNVKMYPNSANVYDSLAEAYEKSGRLDQARPNYEKAYTIGKEKNDPNLAIYKTNFDRVAEKLKQGEAATKK
jgi:uncharacterized protein